MATRPAVIACAVVLAGCRASPALSAEAASHCDAAEQIVFACRVRNSEKVVSVCASKALDETSGYVQYRFGRPGKLELEFPSAREGSQGRFEYAHYFRAQYDLAELRFSSAGHDYIVHYYYNGEDGPPSTQAGVTVGSATLPCAGRVVNRLSALENAVRRGGI